MSGIGRFRAVWTLAALAYGGMACADLEQTVDFDITPQTLQEALIQYSAQSGVQVTSPSPLIEGKSSIGVVGAYAASLGLGRILTGTTLTFDVIDDSTVAIRPLPVLVQTANPATPAPPPAEPAAAPATAGTVPEVVIEAPEPRFAAPTSRDKIGRVWAPVYLNGKGPYRLVLDSGASGSAVTAAVARELGLPLDRTPPVILRGVTGSAQVPTTRVNSLAIGDLVMDPTTVLIVPDALGGAEGILDTNRFVDRRVLIDFRNDEVRISRSHKERAAAGFLTVPFKLTRGKLLQVNAHIGDIAATAIIDTGGQMTLANDALRDALFSRKRPPGAPQPVIGITSDVQMGDTAVVQAIRLGPIEIQQSGVTFGDMRIFEHWKLTRQPTLLIGMETIGMFDTFIIDYKRKELQVRVRGAS